MNTLVAGFQDEAKKILTDALHRRQHQVTQTEPGEEALELLNQKEFPLVILSDYSEEGIQLCRQIRAIEYGERFTIISVLAKNHIDQLYKVLDADVDQYIVESLYDEQRLDVRLAFAEKTARNKDEQYLIAQKLRESEARARSIINTTVDAIITIDRSASIRTFNKAAEEFFLYKASEVIGKNVKLLMPEPYHSEHDQYLENYHETGEPHIIGIGRDVTGLRKDGSTFPMYLAVSEVNVNNQRLYTGIVRDITEQRRLEQEVLRISEHERHRIGQDLHDGLGQMLTGITLINKNIESTLREEGHRLADDVEEITSLVKEADEYARGLSRGLIPVELDSRGLNAALDRMTTNAERLFGIECNFTSNNNIQFDDATSLIHLYRIVQEATSNAVKHGNASKVFANIDANEHRVILKIEDNGTGFPEDWDKQKGLGVRIMQFRARLIGANLEISKSKMGGAAIVCTLLSVGSSYTLIKE